MDTHINIHAIVEDHYERYFDHAGGGVHERYMLTDMVKNFVWYSSSVCHTNIHCCLMLYCILVYATHSTIRHFRNTRDEKTKFLMH